MRKVTASAVILTALTGCGQNNGIPSTQWSFEIPNEDEISSLELGQDTSVAADATFISTVESNQAGSYQSVVDTLSSAPSGSSADGMMGPAFNQPSDALELDGSSRSAFASSRTALPDTEAYGSATAVRADGGVAGRYQPVAARPDPVAQVKAFYALTTVLACWSIGSLTAQP